MPTPLTVVKIGGKVLDDPLQLARLLEDFAALSGPKILVHGGGKAATGIAARLGIKTQMVDGRRITDAPMLEVATMVYGGLMNKQIIAQLQARGLQSLGLTGADLNIIRAHKRPVREVDYGFAGDIESVNASELQVLLDRDIVPVFAPLTHDGSGQLLNTNADTIASAVARSVANVYEVHLIYSFEKAGVLLDAENDDSVIPQLNPDTYTQHKETGVIAAGMIPKLDNAFDALNQGVHRVYICRATQLPQLHKPSFIGTAIEL